MSDSVSISSPSRLQRELKQNKPFATLKNEVIVNLSRTAGFLQHEFERELKPFGITATQYNVLRILRGAGAAGLSQHEIGDRLVARVPDVPRLLARLEKARLITRKRSHEDKRIVVSCLDAAGQTLIDNLDDVLDRVQSSLLTRFSDEDLAKFNEYLYLARDR